VLVKGNGVEKLLAVPNLASLYCGTGEQMAQATVTALMDWNIPFFILLLLDIF